MLKAVKRTPHVITTKVGMSKSSSDSEVDDLKRRFTTVEEESNKLLKDAKAYREAVLKMLTSSFNFGQAYITLLSPMSNEVDLPERYPNASKTIEQMSFYQDLITDLKDTIQPELELIETRIIAPIKEFLEVIKKAKKAITKRDHKLIDFDRHNNSYIKLRDKKEKTLKDEQNIFKVEQDFEAASQEYEYYNNLLKSEIPRFLELTHAFITPLFHSFFYMQLNVLYTTYGKLQQFSEGRFDLNETDIEAIYLERLGNIHERIETLSIIKRPISTAKIIVERRQLAGDMPPSRLSSTSTGYRPPPPLSAKPSVSKMGPPSLSAKPSFSSKPSSSLPPKPNGYRAAPSLTTKPSLAGPASVANPPPPYSTDSASQLSPTTSVATAINARQTIGKAPLAPIKSIQPPSLSSSQTIYVTALYDFAAQAEGDLSFSAGDRIELIKRTESEEDWWTGKLNGVEGIFPGNYVQT
ncbi:hypothetical protein O181_079116 [Austropuccinia psidii MF-1]|uniref:BAR domain-containing protein n=1 Tax=Austropuccinia psidii MF-1 TaxID=1389203 RepID=A0A9Q3FFM3_9BASI|nr:hypothetical protein [Austropuccinia psidii MF-1]